MKNRAYFFTTAIGALAGLIMNMEMLILRGYETIEEQYMDALFPFNEFLEHRQYFVSFKLVLVSLLLLCLVVNSMKNYQLPYVRLRVEKKYAWEFSLTREIVKKAFSFYSGFTLVIYGMSIYACNHSITLLTLKTWLLSLAALVYLGTIFGCIANMLACMMKSKTAVIITYIVFLAATFGTMKYADLFIGSKALLYLNPITAVSITEENSVGMIVLTLLGMDAICFVCRSILAYGYVRRENYVGI